MDPYPKLSREKKVNASGKQQINNDKQPLSLSNKLSQFEGSEPYEECF